MTQEDKKLLFKDLSARLPYGVLVNYCNKGSIPYTNDSILNERILLEFITDKQVELKPYLRSMSSMTETEEKEYKEAYDIDLYNYANMVKSNNHNIIPMYHYIDWLNEHHFDFRGLIEKGLAIKVITI